MNKIFLLCEGADDSISLCCSLSYIMPLCLNVQKHQQESGQAQSVRSLPVVQENLILDWIGVSSIEFF